MIERRTLLRGALAVGIAFLATALVLPPERTAPWRMLVVGLFVAGLGGLRRSTAAGVRPVHAPAGVIDDSGPPPEQVVRLARLEAALGFAVESGRQFDRSVRPLLCELIEQRLTSHHGVVLHDRPAAARALMGEELWQLVEDERAMRTHPGRGPDPALLQRLVAQVQAI